MPTKQVETIASKDGQTPWHGVGANVADKKSVKSMLKAAGLDWNVSKRKLYVDTEGKKINKLEIPGRYALCRDTDDQFLSICGGTYKPIQNETAFNFFQKFTEAGDMTLEHAGSLAEGKYIWALMHLNGDFMVGKDDEIKNYMLLCQPHVAGRAMVIQYTSVRTWCWNTLGSILRGTHGNRGGRNLAFRMSHTSEFTPEIQATAEVALGLALDQQKAFKVSATLLAKKRAKDAEVEDFFCEILQFDPKKAKKKKTGDVREPNALPKFREALTHAPGQQLKSAVGTWWGALNAVTYVVDHQLGNQRSTALRSAWLGSGAYLKQAALVAAVKRAS